MRGRTPDIAACTPLAWLPSVDVPDGTTGGRYVKSAVVSAVLLVTPQAVNW